MRLFIVGIGPGGEEFLTPQAKEAILQSQVIVGYDLYVDLIKPLTLNKEIIATGMKKEVERCSLGLEQALLGKVVSIVCSGDAGVYGMAGIACQLAEPYPQLEITVVPGITAACSGAALLGAPLIHDFAVISLSDLLTPWDKIAKRLLLAAEADFVVCLYNPVSKKRQEHLAKGAELMLRHKSPQTPCGYVKNIGRPGEEKHLCTLGDLAKQEFYQGKIDMFTTVIIGNSQTKVINGRLVTPRGYLHHEE